jgi:hypothetical protein
MRTVNSISSLQVEQRGLSVWRFGTMANTSRIAAQYRELAEQIDDPEQWQAKRRGRQNRIR